MAGGGRDLNAQGSSLRACQTKHSTHVPEELFPTPIVNLGAEILLLAKVLEEPCSLFLRSMRLFMPIINHVLSGSAKDTQETEHLAPAHRTRLDT